MAVAGRGQDGGPSSSAAGASSDVPSPLRAPPSPPPPRQVIPKVRDGLTQLAKATEEHKPLLGHLLYVAAQVRGGSRRGGCGRPLA